MNRILLLPLSAMNYRHLLFSLLCVVCYGTATAQESIDLAGPWHIKADGIDAICQLPGSMLTNHLGDDITVATPWLMQIDEHNPYYKSPAYERYRQTGNIKVPFILQPEKYFVGEAEYQREVVIPKSWKQKSILLTFERCHWLTTLYVDGRLVGQRNDLCAPQNYDLTGVLTPGKHVLTVRVDNHIHDIDPGENAHSVSDNTQGNWNGIAGEMVLKARPLLHIDQLDVYPDQNRRELRVKVVVDNQGRKAQKAFLYLGDKRKEHRFGVGRTEVEEMLPMPADMQPWDEFHPRLYRLTAIAQSKESRHDKSIRFGVRQWENRNGVLTLNGHPVFMRGNVDCCTFPLTGYPSFDKAYWQRVFRVYKKYGLNHVRFHSWCPPEVAFSVADEMGIYCYVECSSWANQSTTLGDGKPIDAFIYQEADAILRAYGNHPSFCMMSYGNEPGGKNTAEYLRKFVLHYQQQDPRHIYTTAAGWPNIVESDFLSDPTPRIQQWGQGLKSIINSQPPSTAYDWHDYTSRFSQPMISHEIGQWCVYPNFREIKKYTGAYRARNFEIFRDRLRDNGLQAYEDSFLIASGRLQTLCYKADIEAALRTKDFGGFELLGLNDFPGQGTALTGVVDVFWDDKGYTNAREFSRFCNGIVPLVRMEKLIYTNVEQLRADVELANYFEPLEREVTWTISTTFGEVLVGGSFPSRYYGLGNCQHVGTIQLPLYMFKEPQQLRLEVALGDIKNEWNFWVYPEAAAEVPSSGEEPEVVVTDTLDDGALSALANGGRVLLSLGRSRVSKALGGEVEVGFSSIFWNTLWTNNGAPHTLGLLCQPDHPSLALFPSDRYSDYQWQDMMTHCDAIRYDLINPGIQPIVRIIDDWFTARPLAMLFEVRVGNGSLLVSGADLITDLDQRPAARQLRRSLEAYMQSNRFHPSTEVSLAEIDKITR